MQRPAWLKPHKAFLSFYDLVNASPRGSPSCMSRQGSGEGSSSRLAVERGTCKAHEGTVRPKTRRALMEQVVRTEPLRAVSCDLVLAGRCSSESSQLALAAQHREHDLPFEAQRQVACQFHAAPCLSQPVHHFLELQRGIDQCMSRFPGDLCLCSHRMRAFPCQAQEVNLRSLTRRALMKRICR